MAYFKVKVSFPASMLEARWLVKLGILSGEYLLIFSWWISVAEKLALSGRIDLVEYMATDTKKEMSQNTFGMPFLFLSFSCIILLRLNTEIQRFSYYGSRWEGCEGTSCFSPLGESSIVVSRLVSLVFCKLF